MKIKPKFKINQTHAYLKGDKKSTKKVQTGDRLDRLILNKRSAYLQHLKNENEIFNCLLMYDIANCKLLFNWTES